jgi:Amt family ammonium transporter
MFGYDDSLDVFGVHALGGAWGALASGIFATTLGAGNETNAAQIMVQLKGIVFVIIFAPIATLAILGILKVIFGSLRVDDEIEVSGLDLGEHSESAYGFAGGSVFEGELGHGKSSHAMSMVQRESHA